MDYSPLLKPDAADFARLARYLACEETIRERERVQTSRLMQQYEKGMMVFQFVLSCGCEVRKGYPLACAVLWETRHPRWFEVGTVWTHVAHRRNGFGRGVVTQLLDLEVARGKSLFSVSSGRLSARAFVAHGFFLANAHNTPRLDEWASSVGLPHSRLPESAYTAPDVPLGGGERALYLRLSAEE